jgi:2-keto-4-pentenoate hydratase/2-oxohepta-3-ene-1,7-dioic acid hydratase in catechol pathway
MIFTVAEIVAFASEAITLEPGDLIATGTPAGVGSRGHRRCGYGPGTRSPSRSTGSERSRTRW